MSTLQLAGCIILDDKKRILLLHRNTDTKQQWEIPGGKLEPGETAEQAAIRELREELGVEIKIISKIGSQNFVEEGLTIHYAWFYSQLVSGTPRLLEPHYFDAVRYFSISELKAEEEPLSLNVKNFINKFQP